MTHQSILLVVAIALLDVTLSSFAAGPSPALGTGDSGPPLNAKQLARAKHCFDCHDTTGPRVGPAFRDLARRFGGLNNAKPMLARMIRTGTDNESVFYHWGPSTMPPDSVRVPVSDEEAQELAEYVLSFAPQKAAR
jgi:cytochrome c